MSQEAAAESIGQRQGDEPHCYVPLVGDREELLQRYLPLVRRVVQRVAGRKPPNIETDDLVSWGIVGLLDAIEKYDPKKEAMFSTYAQFRIRGAILDHLRSLDWVPRSVRQKAARIDKATRALEAEKGRPPTEEEIARQLQLSLPEYQELLTQVGEMALFSVEDMGLGNGDHRLQYEAMADPRDDPAGALLVHERVTLLAEAIRRLPEREQTVIALYYQEDLTMKEVGHVLGLTESRVSQIHSQAVIRLKGHVRDRIEPDGAIP